MHPAFSVIFFTVASGAGYGLLALLGLGFASGGIPMDRMTGGICLGIALVLVTGGLLAAAGHLGRPERAWRAFSQWRSSWLSREGVLSVATYLPAAAFFAGWVLLGSQDGLTRIAALLTAIGALATVSATAMIYASLRTIPDWSNGWTLPAYLVFAVMTGAVVLNAIVAALQGPQAGLGWLAIVTLLGGWAVKVAAWRAHATRPMPVTANSATGLTGGRVRSIEWPHTGTNFVMKEMGYRVARRHAARLRIIAQALAFALPLAGIALMIAVPGPLGIAAAILSALVMIPGILIERWLFFAEARHVVTLYYHA